MSLIMQVCFLSGGYTVVVSGGACAFHVVAHIPRWTNRLTINNLVPTTMTSNLFLP